jgi:hypothetical protein
MQLLSWHSAYVQTTSLSCEATLIGPTSIDLLMNFELEEERVEISQKDGTPPNFQLL